MSTYAQWRLSGAGVMTIGAFCAIAAGTQMLRKRKLEDEKYRFQGSRNQRWQ